MNLEALKITATRFGGRSLLHLKKHAPTILTAAGIVGGVTTTVLASKATLKLAPILDDVKTYADIVKEQRPNVTNQTYARELAGIYARGGLDIIKLYGPTLSVGIVSITCVVSSHNIMQKREASLIAAYAAVERSFAEYRKRVEAAVGKDQEFALRYGLVEEQASSDEKGEIVRASDPNAHSVYARFFDETNPNWRKNAEMNLIFVRAQQQYANDLLHARGHVFLNDVYDSLGIDRSSAGAVVGWVLSKDGDNYVDFGIYDPHSERARMFANGTERSIILDFNVDGVIFDKI